VGLIIKPLKKVCAKTLFLFYKKRKPVLKEKTGKAREEKRGLTFKKEKEKPHFYFLRMQAKRY